MEGPQYDQTPSSLTKDRFPQGMAQLTGCAFFADIPFPEPPCDMTLKDPSRHVSRMISDILEQDPASKR